MYKLFYSPSACSMAIHIILNECNQPVTLEKVNLKEKRDPEFLKLNPRGSVPVLLDGDTVLREGAAIILYLMDKHKSPLLPAAGKERQSAIEWLLFCNATLHPAYSRCFFLLRNTQDPAVKEQLMSVAVAMVNKLWNEVEERLGQSAFLAGDNITAADILMSVIANWKDAIPYPINIGPRTKKLFQTVIARPAYKKALEAEQVEYKAAA